MQIRLAEQAEGRWWVLSPSADGVVRDGAIYHVCRWDAQRAEFVALVDAQTGHPIRARVDLGFLSRPSAWLMGVPADEADLPGAVLVRSTPAVPAAAVAQANEP